MNKIQSMFDIEIVTPQKVVIRDVGGNRGKMSVTNDAENVVRSLYTLGVLKYGVALHYYDTRGHLGGIAHSGGSFTGFYAVA